MISSGPTWAAPLRFGWLPGRVGFALAAWAGAGAALPSGAAAPLAVSVTPAWTSEYLFRGQRLSGASFQPGVDVTGGAFGGGVWSSFPLGEIDPYASATFDVGDGISVQPGATLYTFAHRASLPARGRSTAFEPSLAGNFTVADIRVTPKGYLDLDRHVATGEINAAAALPWRSAGTEIDLGASLGAYTPTGGRTATRRYEGAYWLAQAAVPYQLPNRLRLTATLGYSAGFATTRAVPLRAGRAFVSLALTAVFP